MAKENSGNISVTFSIEPDLVSILDHLCGQRDICRSEAICEALKMWMANELSNNPGFWERAAFGIRHRKDSKSIV